MPVVILDRADLPSRSTKFPLADVIAYENALNDDSPVTDGFVYDSEDEAQKEADSLRNVVRARGKTVANRQIRSTIIDRGIVDDKQSYAFALFLGKPSEGPRKPRAPKNGSKPE